MILILAAKPVAITTMLLWLGALILALVALGLAIIYIRGRLLSRDAGGMEGGLLDNLRAMRDRGAISPEEYDTAKRRLVGEMAAKAGKRGAVAKRDAPAKPGVKPRPAGEVRARPGFDLTGAPLPPPSPGPDPGGISGP